MNKILNEKVQIKICTYVSYAVFFLGSLFNSTFSFAQQSLSSSPVEVTNAAEQNSGSEPTNQKKKVNSDQDTLSYEEKLKTIRESLISEALKARARVKSSAWLDKSGALHENTHITSEVFSLGITKNRLENNNFFDVENIKPLEELNSCNFYNPNYARISELIVTTGRSSFDIPYHELNKIHEKISVIFKEGLQTRQNWIFVEQTKKYNSSYSRYLSASTIEKPEFSIRIFLQTQESFSYQKKSNHVTLKLLLSIVDLNNGGIIASSTYNLPSPWADPPIQAPRSGLAQIAYAVHEASMIGKFRVPSQKAFSKKFERELTFGISELIKKTEESFKCRQITFPITEIRKDEISIKAGEKRGLRIGDQLLLTDTDLIPTRILEESASEKIALIEIKSVTPNRALAVKLAGPDLGPLSKNSRSTMSVVPF